MHRTDARVVQRMREANTENRSRRTKEREREKTSVRSSSGCSLAKRKIDETQNRRSVARVQCTATTNETFISLSQSQFILQSHIFLWPFEMEQWCRRYKYKTCYDIGDVVSPKNYAINSRAEHAMKQKKWTIEREYERNSHLCRLRTFGENYKSISVMTFFSLVCIPILAVLPSSLISFRMSTTNRNYIYSKTTASYMNECGAKAHANPSRAVRTISNLEK